MTRSFFIPLKVFFYSNSTGTSGYWPIINESQAATVYFSSIALGGINSVTGDTNVTYNLFNRSNTILSGSSSVDSNTLSPGPITNNYFDPNYINDYGDAIWVVSKAQVDNHIANFNDPSYIMPPDFVSWPAHGDVLRGESANLAPFYDHNLDGIYNPEEGDYPCIRGDKAIYIIMNDIATPRISDAGTALGMEVHLMLYQFGWPLELKETTFIHYKLHNRSNTDYNNFQLSVLNDFEIGGSIDDYMGIDTNRRLHYIFNGDMHDEGASGAVGFDTIKPAFGIIELNNKLTGSILFNRAGTGGAISGFTDDPTNWRHTYGYMNGIWKNGNPLTYGNSGLDSIAATPTNHMLPGYRDQGWSETSSMRPPGDRRGMLTCSDGTFNSGESKEFDFAYVFAQDTQADDIWDPVDVLFQNSDVVQDFYDNMDFSCLNGTADLNESQLDFSLFPNPANTILNISTSGEFDYTLFDVSGQIVRIANKQFNSTQINVSTLNKGIYIIEITQNGFKSNKKIIIQ